MIGLFACMMAILSWRIDRSHGFIAPQLRDRKSTSGNCRPNGQKCAYIRSSSLNGVRVEVASGDGASIHRAARLMVESFWLGSPLNVLRDDNEDVEITEAAKRKLIQVQEEQFTEIYGERMGKRLLPSCLLMAYDDDDALVGMATLEVTLLAAKQEGEKFLKSTDAEQIIKGKIAALRPPQRRQYTKNDVPLLQMASSLLPSPDLGLVICLSNVCVSPDARRRGIAETICQTAEALIKEQTQDEQSPLFGIDEVYLKVETANAPAKTLYQNKLGYAPVLTNDIWALRVDPKTGTFLAQTVETTIMHKQLT